MTTAEAAQRWAEAKEKLGAAVAALDQANTAHDAAAKEEHEAWEALEALANEAYRKLKAHYLLNISTQSYAP